MKKKPPGRWDYEVVNVQVSEIFGILRYTLKQVFLYQPEVSTFGDASMPDREKHYAPLISGTLQERPIWYIQHG